MNLENEQPGRFFDVEYPIPKEQVNGKTTVTVRFQSREGTIAGGVFECGTYRAGD